MLRAGRRNQGSTRILRFRNGLVARLVEKHDLTNTKHLQSEAQKTVSHKSDVSGHVKSKLRVYLLPGCAWSGTLLQRSLMAIG